MTDFIIKRNDTSPAIEYQLQDDSGSPVDISGFNEVGFHMEEQGADTTVINDDTAGNVSVTDAANGTVKYAWQAVDTEQDGFYDAEWEVEYSDGTIETFPNDDFIRVRITKDLG